jgi:hypothetical protein
VHFAFDRQAERRPPEHRSVPEYRIPALDFHILGVGVPGRPPAFGRQSAARHSGSIRLDVAARRADVPCE